MRYFVAVAEELHFGRAAKRLYITQPSLSAQIRQLEEEIQVKLFHRTKRRVELTEAGLAFYHEARRTMSQAERSVYIARSASRGETGRLALGFINAAIYNVLPDILRTVRKRVPDIVLTLHELTSEEQTRDLVSGRIDAGLMRPPVGPGQLSAMTVHRELFVVALPEGHPLSSYRVVPLPALAEYPFLMTPRHGGPMLYDRTIDACRRAGFSPRVAQEADHMQTIVGLVAAGLGVALVPASIQHLRRAGVVYRPFRGASEPIEMALAWRRDDPSSCVSTFLRLVAEVTGTTVSAPPTPAKTASLGR